MVVGFEILCVLAAASVRVRPLKRIQARSVGSMSVPDMVKI